MPTESLAKTCRARVRRPPRPQAPRAAPEFSDLWQLFGFKVGIYLGQKQYRSIQPTAKLSLKDQVRKTKGALPGPPSRQFRRVFL